MRKRSKTVVAAEQLKWPLSLHTYTLVCAESNSLSFQAHIFRAMAAAAITAATVASTKREHNCTEQDPAQTDNNVDNNEPSLVEAAHVDLVFEMTGW